MPKKSITLLLVSVFVVVALFVIYYFLPQMLNNEAEVVETNVTESVFENFNNLTDTAEEIASLEPENRPSVEIQRILSNDQEYWENWNWREKLVELRIDSVDPDSNEITATIARPKDKAFSGDKVRAYIDCPLEHTALIFANEPLTIVESSDVYWGTGLASQDILHTYCLGSDCRNFGRQCIITRTDSVN